MSDHGPVRGTGFDERLLRDVGDAPQDPDRRAVRVSARQLLTSVLTVVIVAAVLGAAGAWAFALYRLNDAGAAGRLVDTGIDSALDGAGLPAEGPGTGADPLAPAATTPADPSGGADPSAAPATGAPAADPSWVAATASRVGIPPRALQAYAAADLRLRTEEPACALSWATLAGIGWVESHHGGYLSEGLAADGRPAGGPIIGVALDGEGPVSRITDTDAGALDGDTEWDRAVGPLQFIPTTWARWGSDGDGDGVADPQDVDDAAYSSGRYLCASGSPLTDPQQWYDAVRAYNNSDAYAVEVVTATNWYAERSLARTPD